MSRAGSAGSGTAATKRSAGAPLKFALPAALAAAIATGCTRISFWLANAPAQFESCRRIADLRFGDDPRQSLDLYVPAHADGLPVVVFWYGGSWTSGRKADYRFVAAALAAHGMIVAIPDYRLHPSVVFPAFVEDGAQAVAWLQSHVGEYGGDPTRMVLAGHSAGAYIAAFLALDDDALGRAGAQRSAIKGLIGLAGPYGLEPDTPVMNTIFAAPYTPPDWQPVRFVDPGDPPALLIHGDKDRTVGLRHTLALRDALTAVGVPVQVEIVPGASHVDLVASFARLAPKRAPVLEDSLRFIRSVTASAE